MLGNSIRKLIRGVKSILGFHLIETLLLWLAFGEVDSMEIFSNSETTEALKPPVYLIYS